MVSKFPTTIKIDVKMKVLHHAMLSAMERTVKEELNVFTKLVFVANVSIIFCCKLTDDLCRAMVILFEEKIYSDFVELWTTKVLLHENYFLSYIDSLVTIIISHYRITPNFADYIN